MFLIFASTNREPIKTTRRRKILILSFFIFLFLSNLNNKINLFDGYKVKKIPFIIRRPIPNGGTEYWKLQDLELLETY